VAALGLTVGFFALSAHLATQAWYSDRILPGVVVAGKNIGGLTMAQARQAIKDNVSGYHLGIDVGGQKYELLPKDIAMSRWSWLTRLTGRN